MEICVYFDLTAFSAVSKHTVPQMTAVTIKTLLVILLKSKKPLPVTVIAAPMDKIRPVL